MHGLLTNTNKNLGKKKNSDPHPLAPWGAIFRFFLEIFERQKWITLEISKVVKKDSADMCAGKFPLVLMGGLAEGLACADPGARTPIGASGIVNSFYIQAATACTVELYYQIFYHSAGSITKISGPENWIG